MNISGPFIARPVATTLLAIAVFLVGVLGYTELPVSSLPEVSFPTIVVVTKLPGASPDTVSKLITAPLERQFGEIAGLAAMSSVSGEGTSTVTLRFDLSVSLSTAAQDVQAAINAASGELPPNLQYPPVYREVNPADAPILTLALTSKTIPLYKVANFAQTLFLQKLSEIRGVGEVTIAGGLRKAIRIDVNPARLAAYGLSLEDVRNAVVNVNQAGPTGGLQGRDRAYAIGTNDQIELARQYRRLLLAYRNGAPVTLGAVGHVHAGLENDQELASYDNTPAVVLEIQREPGANIVSTVARVEAALRTLRKTLPPGVHLRVVANRTGTIKASVADVQITLLTAMLLVVLVIFLFLPNPRATFIPAVVLPLSIVATFAVMYELGYQLDNLSLMALTVATGFVVDDAIVMIENIVRFVEAGEPPLRAAYLGAQQIGFTIVSLTVSLIAVFIPLLFMSGVIGRLFSEFAVTLSVAVVASAVISLTLTPMMGARLLKPASEVRPHRLARAAEHLLERARASYRTGLGWCLRHQRFMLVVFAGTVVLTVALFLVIPKALLPEVDTGEIVAVTQGPQNASLRAMARLQGRAITTILHNPSVAGVTSLIGPGATNPTPNTGRLTIVLKPIGRRPSLATVMRELGHALHGVPGLRFYMQPVQDITLSSRVTPAEYQYTLTDTNAPQLRRWSTRLEKALRALPELRDVSSNQENRGLEAYVDVNRDAAALGGAISAAHAGLITPVFIGPERKIRHAAKKAGLDLSPYTLLATEHSHAAADEAVALARRGEVEAVMKGSLHTDELMHAVVDPARGLRTDRRVSHVFVLDVPDWPRLLLLTDAAVNVTPDLEAKRDIVQNAVDLAHVLGIPEPRVALLSSVETVTPRIPSTLDAAALCKMVDRGQITGAILDGPLAFDNAVSARAARTKGIHSAVAGRADILVVPDLDAGNMLAKGIEYLDRARLAGLVLGTRVPVILTSRADLEEARMASCALAVFQALAPHPHDPGAAPSPKPSSDAS